MTELWSTVSDSLQFDILGGLLLAVLLGGAVGLERELHGKAAGLLVVLALAALRCVESLIARRSVVQQVTVTSEGSLAKHHAVQSRYLGLASDVSVRVDE